MKRLSLFFWMFVSGTGLLANNHSVLLVNVDSLFHAANALYEEGNYEQALNTYREINTSGEESAGLYYNMGNAAFRSNNIGYAILYYEKALKLDPAYEDARHNLEFVSQYKVDTFEGVPEFFLRAWVGTMVNSLSEKTWSILSILLFAGMLTGVLVYLFSRRLSLKKTGFFMALFALLLFAVTFSSALTRHHRIVHPEEGIITVPTVVVRSSPSETGTELFVLHEGTRVKVNEEVSDWQNIRVEDGREGWITISDFESI